MTRWRLYPAKPSGKLVKTFSLDVLRNLDDTPAKVHSPPMSTASTSGGR